MNHLLSLRGLSACCCVLAALSGCTGNAMDSPAIETGDAAIMRAQDASVPPRDGAMAPSPEEDVDAAVGDAAQMAEAAVREASVDGSLRADAADTSVASQGAAQQDATQGDAAPRVADSGEAALAPSVPVVERLITAKEMPISERGVYTDNGRFFVVGGPVLYEVAATQSGFEAIVLLRETCTMGGAIDRGNVLYIACMHDGDPALTELLRVDPTAPGGLDVRRAVFPELPAPVMLNGMEFGPDGALYISNTGAFLSGASALSRVVIVSETPLVIQVSGLKDPDPFADALGPNGLRFQGNMLYFSTGASLVRMELGPDGAHGTPVAITSLDLGLGVFDDFDLSSDRLFIAQTDSADVLAVQVGGPAIGSPFGSPLLVTTLAGTIERRLDVDFIPSSTAVRRNTLFGPAAVIVTSFFNGGLYRVSGLY